MVFLGNRGLMDTQKLSLCRLEAEATRLQAEGRTVVRPGSLASSPSQMRSGLPPIAAVTKLRAIEIDVVMLTGDSLATATRIAADLGIDTVLADVLPAQKAER